MLHLHSGTFLQLVKFLAARTKNGERLKTATPLELHERCTQLVRWHPDENIRATAWTVRCVVRLTN